MKKQQSEQKTIGKELILAAKIASKSKNRPVLQSVFIDDEKLVATDCYKLIEIKRKDNLSVNDFPELEDIKKVDTLGEGIMINASDVIENQKFFSNKNLEILEHGSFCNLTKNYISIATTKLDMTTVNQYKIVDGTFPKYQEIFPKNIRAKISLTRHLLIELLNGFDENVIEFCLCNNKQSEPLKLIIKTENKTGMLMPIKK